MSSYLDEEGYRKVQLVVQALKDEKPIDIDFMFSLFKSSFCCLASLEFKLTLGMLNLMRTHLIEGHDLSVKENQLNFLQKILIKYKTYYDLREKDISWIYASHVYDIDSWAVSVKYEWTKEAQTIKRRSFGLYPGFRFNGTKKQSAFALYHRDSKLRGNPNWLLSRFQLSLWFNIRRHTLSLPLQKVYSFLLSQPQFMQYNWGPITKVWSVMYCAYTAYILNQQVQFESQKAKITWSQSTSLEKAFERSAILPKKQEYFCVQATLILLRQLEKKDSSEALENHFHKFCEFARYKQQEFSWADMLYKALVDDISRRKGWGLSPMIRRNVNEGLKNNITRYNIYFLSYFLTSEQIIKLTQKDKKYGIYQYLYFTQEERQEVFSTFIKNGYLSTRYMDMLTKEQFFFIFTTEKWAQFEFQSRFLFLINQNKEIFVKGLINNQKDTKYQDADKALSIFLNCWGALNKMTKQNQIQFNHFEIQEIFKINRKDLMQFDFLILPRDVKPLSEKILIDILTRYEKFKDQLTKINSSVLHMWQKFQDNLLWIFIDIVPKSTLKELATRWNFLPFKKISMNMIKARIT